MTKARIKIKPMVEKVLSSLNVKVLDISIRMSYFPQETKKGDYSSLGMIVKERKKYPTL